MESLLHSFYTATTRDGMDGGRLPIRYANSNFTSV